MAQTAEKSVQKANYGLRREILSPMETLAQSFPTMAPTTTPAATIPLVCALAGNGTCCQSISVRQPDAERLGHHEQDHGKPETDPDIVGLLF
jgi:hypothetical protein